MQLKREEEAIKTGSPTPQTNLVSTYYIEAKQEIIVLAACYSFVTGKGNL